ncbi:cobalamin biosynthesis protein [Streptacidiphilus sp. PB12-B1b]|nr:cobalamin biosynthesis protein [Streptacidiphilus sp. PB12-B1b]QMU78551.1 cobalamin biosynthesis protein [Streptacidiphilus sp. PB12-B1b]
MRSAPALGVAAGYAADAAFGDPRRGHPVAGFGRAAGALERRLWRDHRAVGAAFTALCVGTVAAGAIAAERAVRGPSGGGSSVRSPGLASAGRMLLAGAATWTVLGGASLVREARTIGGSLHAGDLPAARARLPYLCGRDPRGLTEQQIARAVVESVAENTADAVVNALVWGALAGTPGLLAFRAVNTLDAMVGHRSPRYLRFGWASARLDDVAGWPGARLTALLTVAAAGPGRRAETWRVWRRDASAHPSPNAGQAEAAFAGALGVRLGGTLAYGTRTEHRPVLAAECRPVAVGDIERACVLSRRVGLLAVGAAVAAVLLRERLGGRGRERR